ncbi:MAG: alanine--glyoxylate aminotransferase family protein [Cyclobacteriaceae bacterium]|nr:alanine--glyoxylate aminotransferase family protein [Cyclobacteriaceae bacterium]
MISFYPGPSRVYDGVPRWTADAYKKGILSMNHRSAEFMDLVKETTALLRRKLRVPKDYSVLFVSSATECWEIIAQSLVERESLHAYNGAFGEKWFRYTQKLNPRSRAHSFDFQAPLDPSALNLGEADLLCLTQNETSNGTALSPRLLKEIRTRFPQTLNAVDATSSMAGINLDFKLADVWFASVQKCFGLPAGLALLICSPRAAETARRLARNNHYNSLAFQLEMIAKHQTTHTPNVLGIYLLYRSLESVSSIRETDALIRRRAAQWVTFFKKHPRLSLLVKEDKVLSHTVLTVTSSTSLQTLKERAKQKGLLLGEGYGPWKETTFRIANFPAHKVAEISKLKKFLAS